MQTVSGSNVLLVINSQYTKIICFILIELSSQFFVVFKKITHSKQNFTKYITINSYACMRKVTIEDLISVLYR